MKLTSDQPLDMIIRLAHPAWYKMVEDYLLVFYEEDAGIEAYEELSMICYRVKMNFSEKLHRSLMRGKASGHKPAQWWADHINEIAAMSDNETVLDVLQLYT